MKMFNWIQQKLKGRHVSKKLDLASSGANHYKQQEPIKEEFIDWHKGLLTIGTIGNDSLLTNLQESPSSSHDHSQDLTPEEEGKLQNELKVLLQEHFGPFSAAEPEEDPDFSLDEFPKHSKLVAVEKKSNTDICSDDLNKDGSHVQRSTSLVFSRWKDICTDNSTRAIRKKSLSFLVKKMIDCRGGFAPARSLRGPVSEARMERILRAILHKRIYPQRSSATLATKTCLESRERKLKSVKDDTDEKPENGSKWVKTDSEYIVLEI